MEVPKPLEKLENVILNLQVLSELKKGQKLDTSNNIFKIDENVYGQFWSRWYRGDSRKKTINLLSNLEEDIKNILEYLKEPSEQEIEVLEKLGLKRHQTLQSLEHNMTNGFNGLKVLTETYENDVLIKNKLIGIQNKFNELIKNIVKSIDKYL